MDTFPFSAASAVVTDKPDIRSPPLPSSPAEALRCIPWLRHVSPGTLDELTRQAVLHRIPAGSVLFRQSEVPTFAQLLVSGAVELAGVEGGSEVLIETIRPFDLLLPAAVLSERPYLARGSVREEANILLIRAGAFREVVASDLALSLAVLACQAAQFRRQIKLARNLKLRSAEERVGCYLLRLVQGKIPGVPAVLPAAKARIAGELGMTRETFSRTLAAMPRFGLRVAGSSVVVTDAAALHARFRLHPLIDAPEPIVPLAPLARRRI